MSEFMNNADLSEVLSEFDDTQQPTVLVVDDIQDNLDLVVDVLEDEPWTIKTASNAQEAAEVLKSARPDLILLDIQMPGIDGHQLCAAIRRHPHMQDVQIIFLTAERLSSADVVRGLELGADDYICKPFNADELRARVRTALRRRPSGTSAPGGDVPGA